MVEVTGKDEEQTKTIRYSGISHMRHGTATPAAIGAKMIAEGNINQPGVNAPEGSIPPEEFVMNFLNIQGLGDAWFTITQKMNALPFP
jgi:saccharopine dehydrogenase-like NADP-dependent oxidoreductase